MHGGAGPSGKGGSGRPSACCGVGGGGWPSCPRERCDRRCVGSGKRVPTRSPGNLHGKPRGRHRSSELSTQAPTRQASSSEQRPVRAEGLCRPRRSGGRSGRIPGRPRLEPTVPASSVLKPVRLPQQVDEALAAAGTREGLQPPHAPEHGRRKQQRPVTQVARWMEQPLEPVCHDRQRHRGEQDHPGATVLAPGLHVAVRVHDGRAPIVGDPVLADSRSGGSCLSQSGYTRAG